MPRIAKQSNTASTTRYTTSIYHKVASYRTVARQNHMIGAALTLCTAAAEKNRPRTNARKKPAAYACHGHTAPPHLQVLQVLREGRELFEGGHQHLARHSQGVRQGQPLHVFRPEGALDQPRLVARPHQPFALGGVHGHEDKHRQGGSALRSISECDAYLWQETRGFNERGGIG